MHIIRLLVAEEASVSVGDAPTVKDARRPTHVSESQPYEHLDEERRPCLLDELLVRVLSGAKEHCLITRFSKVGARCGPPPRDRVGGVRECDEACAAPEVHIL